MSRCFGYPPPGYSPNTATNYALIESIKLQRDREKDKSERKKEKKREKKERKREKKEKAKQKKAEQESTSSRDKKLIPEGDNGELKTRYLQKDIEDEFVERLEDSSLSEEHGPSQNRSYSSDSTQSNKKRKRSPSPSNGIHSQGTVVRIRFSSQKHGQCDTSTRECFTKSAKQEAEVSIRTPTKRVPPLSETNNQLFPSTPVSEQYLSPSVWTEPIAEDKSTTASCSKSHENDIELEYKNLIANCVPPSLHYDFDDQDWLFQRKSKHMRVKEKVEVSKDTSCGTSALWPRGLYLEDAQLYAFPFTVPF